MSTGNGKKRIPLNEYLYYPGCSLEASAHMYDISSRAVMKALGSNLKELDDWNCCGATSYMSIRELRAFAVSSRNLALAEMAGHNQLITVCNACFTTLCKTNEYFQTDLKLQKQIKDALSAGGLKYEGNVEVRHLLDVIANDFGVSRILDFKKKDLYGMVVAPYYGCQLSRPHGTFDDPENPTSFDPILRAIGCEVAKYPMRAKCCGGAQMITAPNLAYSMVRDVLKSAEIEHAECIVCFCPMCHINLDCYTKLIEQKTGEKFTIPILYFTQVLGLGLGLSSSEVVLGREMIDSSAFIKKYAGSYA